MGRGITIEKGSIDTKNFVQRVGESGKKCREPWGVMVNKGNRMQMLPTKPPISKEKGLHRPEKRVHQLGIRDAYKALRK